jgi:hypothetical protein
LDFAGESPRHFVVKDAFCLLTTKRPDHTAFYREAVLLSSGNGGAAFPSAAADRPVHLSRARDSLPESELRREGLRAGAATGIGEVLMSDEHPGVAAAGPLPPGGADRASPTPRR